MKLVLKDTQKTKNLQELEVGGAVVLGSVTYIKLSGMETGDGESRRGIFLSPKDMGAVSLYLKDKNKYPYLGKLVYEA